MTSLRWILLSLALTATAWGAPPWSLVSNRAARPVSFAASEIRGALSGTGASLIEEGFDRLAAPPAGMRIVIACGIPEIRQAEAALRVSGPAHREDPQSYAIRRAVRDGRTTIAVLGAGEAGAMYGGLDVAEAIRLGTIGSLADSDHAPRIERRGIKFNVPLDLRTPSYSDNSDAAQFNIPEMWSRDFWHEFLDEMARHRFNVLSLWNLHPFPSLVKVPEFPEVALDDVQRTRVPLDDTYSLSGSDMYRPELSNRVETVKRMTIAGKMEFWRDIMQYARDRGIEVYWFTWNLFTYGAEGKHGITAAQDNPKTIEYFRASIREMVLAYPLLAGFGITAGERMENRRDQFAKEKWLWSTYGEGVRDALKLAPGRQVRMIHRFHQTGMEEAAEEWKNYPGTLDFSFKYAIAHMYSIPNPPFLAPVLPHLSPARRTWLTVRDDDYYSFRWGNPGYAREFIRNMPGKDKMAGFYMGPDGTIWGREFLSNEPETPREPVIRKRWFGFMLWGRLSYEPDLPDELFERTLAVRFPAADPAKLMRAWSEASMIFPWITRFFWGDIDLRWFPEACLSHASHRGFYTVEDFIRGESMPGSGVLSIRDWRARQLTGTAMDGVTPLEVAAKLEQHARAALELAGPLRAAEGSNKELRLTLGDLTAMSYLGSYYAAKIRGAAELALFDKTGKVEQRDAAVRHLFQALTHWRRYAGAYTLQYAQPRLYNRIGVVDIPALRAKAEQDIVIARQWRPGTIPDSAAARQADTPFRK
jgi:hypothetical protein